MNKIINISLVFLLIPQLLLANCDWSTIKKNDDGSYTYSKELHICVGEMKRDLDIANKQNEAYVKALELKDLAIKNADERIALWMDTTNKLEDRINKAEGIAARNGWIYFGLGAVTVLGAGFMASKLIR